MLVGVSSDALIRSKVDLFLEIFQLARHIHPALFDELFHTYIIGERYRINLIQILDTFCKIPFSSLAECKSFNSSA
jgi:hypothetical protein